MLSIHSIPSLPITPNKRTSPERYSDSPITVCVDQFTSITSSDSSSFTNITNVTDTAFQNCIEPTPLERVLVVASPYLCGLGPSTEYIHNLRSAIEKYDLNQILAKRNYSPRKSS